MHVSGLLRYVCTYLGFSGTYAHIWASQVCMHISGLLRYVCTYLGFSGGTGVKEPVGQGRRHKRFGFDPWVGKIPWRKAQQPTPVFLPGESLDGGAWWATVHRSAKSHTRLKWLSTQARIHLFFHRSFSHTGYWIESPLLYSRSLMISYFMYSGVCMWIPNLSFILSPTFPLW